MESQERKGELIKLFEIIEKFRKKKHKREKSNGDKYKNDIRVSIYQKN
jgi:hypothetical protein